MTTPSSPSSRHVAPSSPAPPRESRPPRWPPRAGPARARPATRPAKPTLTVLGTTDLHGNVYNWDYFKNAEFDDAAHNDIGVAKVKTVIDRERARRSRPGARPRRRRHHPGHPAGLLLRQGPARSAAASIHPMARAMNLIGYDAAALGNHEFNYGIPLLRTFESQLNFPLLGANAVDPATKRPVFAPYVIKEIDARPRPGRSRSASSA